MDLLIVLIIENIMSLIHFHTEYFDIVTSLVYFRLQINVNVSLSRHLRSVANVRAQNVHCICFPPNVRAAYMCLENGNEIHNMECKESP